MLYAPSLRSGVGEVKAQVLQIKRMQIVVSIHSLYHPNMGTLILEGILDKI